MIQQTSTRPQNKKLPKPLKVALISIAAAIVLVGIVFAVDRLILGGKLFPDGDDLCPIDKPIIYLYPEKETEVSVTLGFPEKLTTVYPKYNNGWHVLAEPDGKLTDLSTGRGLYALYWEGKDGTYRQTDEGFVVKGADTATFLEEKLQTLGLNYKESEEFIVYWLPKLEKNNYNYIRFATNEEIESNMPLSVTPKPDTTIRIMMVWRALEKPIEIKEQVLKTPTRTGFTVVEWGGSEL